MQTLIKSFIPEAGLLTNIGAEMTLQLPLHSSSIFQEMFEAIDAQKNELSVVNYGISVTTFEEVFIKVATGDHDKVGHEKFKRELAERKDSFRKNGNNGAENDANAAADLEMSLSKKAENFDKLDASNNFGYFILHMRALFYKRSLYFLRDKRL
jgi:ATP-binding cassette subfamily A (ABC1) protein 3